MTFLIEAVLYLVIGVIVGASFAKSEWQRQPAIGNCGKDSREQVQIWTVLRFLFWPLMLPISILFRVMDHNDYAIIEHKEDKEKAKRKAAEKRTRELEAEELAWRKREQDINAWKDNARELEIQIAKLVKLNEK